MGVVTAFGELEDGHTSFGLGRNPFSVEKMTYVAETGTVIYRSGMSHGKHKKNFEVFDAPAFIPAVTQHIPPKGFQMVRYYGRYSNRARGSGRRWAW